ncbi:hypothetical protein PTKIN_Ptkin07bG0271900 [Pterospermum kingtungense]
MEGVRCISSAMVQAATHKAENQRVEFTPWDFRYLLVGPIQKGLLFPKPEKEADENTFIHHLKTSLSNTLDYFTPLAGRLATIVHDDGTISFFIDCNSAGALFIHAEADGVTISDMVEPVYVPPVVHSFFPLNGTKNHQGIFKPLLGVQVTVLMVFLLVLPSIILWLMVHRFGISLIHGARPRLHKLPEQYFGNAIRTRSITMKAKELQELRLGNIAMELNRMIATQTEEEFIKNLESWITSPKLVTMAEVTSNVMKATSLPRFNMYGNDFGWGRPVVVRSGSANKFEGKLTLFCGVEEGSIDIEACLSPETLDAMASDQEFMDTVTI